MNICKRLSIYITALVCEDFNKSLILLLLLFPNHWKRLFKCIFPEVLSGLRTKKQNPIPKLLSLTHV